MKNSAPEIAFDKCYAHLLNLTEVVQLQIYRLVTDKY